MKYGKDTPIVIWTLYGYKQVVEKAIELYHEINSDILFDVKELSSEEMINGLIGWSDFESLPNILLVHDTDLNKYFSQFENFLVRLNEVADIVDTNEFLDFKIEDATNLDGILYGCPFTSEQVALYFNKDILDDIGVDADRLIGQNITWDELIELGKKIKDSDSDCYLLPSPNWYSKIMLQSSGKLFYDSDGNIVYDEVKEVLEIIETLTNNGLIYPEEIDYDELQTLLANGNIAAVIGAPYWFTTIKNMVTDNGLDQEWIVAQTPKTDTLNFNVNMGGTTWLVFDKDAVRLRFESEPKSGADAGEDSNPNDPNEPESYVFDFISQIFGNKNDLSGEFIRIIANEYDIVPAIAYPWSSLENLDNNGCFGSQEVIKYLIQFGKDVPKIYYEERTSEILQNFNEAVNMVYKDGATAGEAFNKFYEDGETDEDDPDRVLERIEIETAPLKTTYYEYEYFSSFGMIVRAYFSDGTNENVTSMIVSEPKQLFSGTEHVEISYTYKQRTESVNQPVTVLKRQLLGIRALDSYHLFLQGENLSKSQFYVIANYNEGPDRYVTDFTFAPPIFFDVGQNTLKFYYTENEITVETELTITVHRKLDSISVLSLPKKLSYYKGERFDRTGMSIQANYLDGTQNEISAGSLNITPQIIKFPDGKNFTYVTVSYTENGIQKSTDIRVFKKYGADLENADITQNLDDNSYGTVNLSTGHFTFNFIDFMGCDSVIPITISHLYKDDIGNTHFVGNNWRLNVQQEIVLKNGRWVYTDQNGKEHTFSNGFEKSEERSSVRNEELGLDLFVLPNDKIKLVNRENDTFEFTLINEIYRHTATHIFPSTIDNPIEEYSLNIVYYDDGKINAIKAGKRINGKRPCVEFVYINNLLVALDYICLQRTNVATYVYSDSKLETIKFSNDRVKQPFGREYEFVYWDSSFKVFNQSSKNAAGKAQYLKYSLDNKFRVKAFAKGYDETEEDVTSIDYFGGPLPKDKTTDIVLSTYVRHNNTVSVVSFDSMGVVSKYSYEIKNDNFSKPQKINYAVSRDFDYKKLADIYSDTLDIAYDEFNDDKCGWTGSLTHKAVNGVWSISGTSLEKTFTLSSSDIEKDTTMFLSFWLLGIKDKDIQVSITVKSGSDVGSVVHKICANVPDRWQFVAYCLGKRKIGDQISIKISCESGVCLDVVRITKQPYEIPDDITDPSLDDFGNTTSTYQYNPILDKVVHTQYTYDAQHQLITQENRIVDGDLINRFTNTYTDGLLTSKKTYGKSSEYYTEEKSEYENYVLTSTEDTNDVVTEYNFGTDEITRTVRGETNSPDISQKEVFYADSGVLKNFISNELQNEITYLSSGSIEKIRYNYNSGTFNGEIKFDYDTFGNINKVNIGNVALETLLYNYKHLEKITYANGDCLSYAYDDNDRVTSILENELYETKFLYSDNENDLITVTNANGVQYTSQSVNKNEITNSYSVNFPSENHSLLINGYAANSTGNVSTIAYFMDGETTTPFEKCVSTSDYHGLLTKILRSYHGADNYYTYDDHYRLQKKQSIMKGISIIKTTFSVEYNYQNIAAYRRGTRVNTETFKIGNTQKHKYQYEYYKNGNLKKISENSTTQSEYIFDEYGRLIWEYNYALYSAYKFTYDNGGNITKKETYAILNKTVATEPANTDTYDYSTITPECGQNDSWKDQLKSYNGTPVKYDQYGNPLSYRGKEMKWRGRKLIELDGVGMEYDYNGLRLKKGNKIYFWQDNKLIMERWTQNGNENYIYYYYDESGVCGMNYNNAEYYFHKNVLGDILGIYDQFGALQCRYVYDAWGNHKVYYADGTEIASNINTIGNINPFRYRGYYWDTEFGLYYLQSRYYDPAVGRFISPDDVSYLDPENIVGLNLYAYCGNNPVMYIDPAGTAFGWIAALIIGFAALAVGVTNAVISSRKEGATANKIALDFFKGFFLGAAIGASLVVLGSIGIGVGLTLFTETLSITGLIKIAAIAEVISNIGLLLFGMLTGIEPPDMVGFPTAPEIPVLPTPITGF